MALTALFKNLAEFASGLFSVQPGQELVSGSLGSNADGTGENRSIGQLLHNDIAMMTALQGLNTLLFDGGTISWDGSALVFTDELTIHFGSVEGGTSSNVVSAASSTGAMTDGSFVYVILDRETDGAALSPSVAANGAALLAALTGAARLDLVILGKRSGAQFILFNGQKLTSGTHELYIDSRYANKDVESQFPERVNAFVYGGGLLDFDDPTGNLSWTESIYVRTGMAAGAMVIAPGSVSLSPGQGAYISWDYTSSGATTTLTVANFGSIPTISTVFILAVRDAVEDGFVTLWNGQAVGNSRKRVIGDIDGVVATLTGNSGPDIAGPVAVLQGTGITTLAAADPSWGGTITITNTIDDLVDLNNVTSDLEDAVLAAKNQSAAVSNPLLTSDFVNNIQGFDCMWADGGTQLKVSPGILQSGGEWYPSSSSINVSASDLDTGSISAGNWYYIYVTPGLTPGGAPVIKLSATAPTGLSRHPANATWRYIGPVYFYTTTQMQAMGKTGGTIKMFNFLVTTEVSGLLGATPTSANLSTVLPDTVGGGLVITIEASAIGGTPGRVNDIQVADSTGVIRNCDGIIQDDAGGAPYNILFNRVYFPVPINAPYLIQGQIDSGTYGSLGFAYLEEFYEPQFGLRI